jgi:hypothetical protein
MQRPTAPRPHRCNDRIEDAISGLFESSDPREHFLPLARLAWRCFRSEPGQEPQEPYKFVDPAEEERKRRAALEAGQLRWERMQAEAAARAAAKPKG